MVLPFRDPLNSTDPLFPSYSAGVGGDASCERNVTNAKMTLLMHK